MGFCPDLEGKRKKQFKNPSSYRLAVWKVLAMQFGRAGGRAGG
jgi:hypothetical protein